jgi:menaquinone-dependent protoporphyrinogen oxidase
MPATHVTTSMEARGGGGGMTRVLIAYGSKRGSTGEIAKAIGWTFEEMGLEVDVRRAAEVEDVGPYEAVVLGGAVYKNRWHRDARRFGRRFVGPLRDRPVWLFSSGPLDLTAEERKIPPVAFVAKLAERIGARDHATFGGRLASHPSGYAASVMAERLAGDYRNFAEIRAWASRIGREIGARVASRTD